MHRAAVEIGTVLGDKTNKLSGDVKVILIKGFDMICVIFASGKRLHDDPEGIVHCIHVYSLDHRGAVEQQSLCIYDSYNALLYYGVVFMALVRSQSSKPPKSSAPSPSRSSSSSSDIPAAYGSTLPSTSSSSLSLSTLSPLESSSPSPVSSDNL